jgi:hypothetical protein
VSSRIVDFYSGESTDGRGRTLDEILRWSDDQLEFTHDYIQWLFPTTEPSGFNPRAPILDRTAREAFRSRPELRERLRAAFLRMLAFYGFRLEQACPPRVVRAADFPERSRNWLSPANHNHLRLTRILKSLGLLGLEAESAALFDALEDLYRAGADNVISATTFRFWQAAKG